MTITRTHQSKTGTIEETRRRPGTEIGSTEQTNPRTRTKITCMWPRDGHHPSFSSPRREKNRAKTQLTPNLHRSKKQHSTTSPAPIRNTTRYDEDRREKRGGGAGKRREMERKTKKGNLLFFVSLVVGRLAATLAIGIWTRTEKRR